jgi:hypothetical protein
VLKRQLFLTTKQAPSWFFGRKFGNCTIAQARSGSTQFHLDPCVISLYGNSSWNWNVGRGRTASWFSRDFDSEEKGNCLEFFSTLYSNSSISSSEYTRRAAHKVWFYLGSWCRLGLALSTEFALYWTRRDASWWISFPLRILSMAQSWRFHRVHRWSNAESCCRWITSPCQ